LRKHWDLDYTSALNTVNNLGNLYVDRGKHRNEQAGFYQEKSECQFILMSWEDFGDFNAQIAFQYEIKHQDSILRFANIQCGVCGLPIMGERQRFVCRQCGSDTKGNSIGSNEA
jgi:ribosomal protein S27AE